ncbi:sensor histidine kinase [Streptomyces violaceusniger]|uniref:histidine kinase n=1 Tax=Streptomyces violaceusniger (strain Tu 4113) TaxID=653045 RepID=G2PFS3_STRV4|nr:ATP-binding protein [Streptomyces violaceusniger]AEM84854.1 putative signal transduction histidine kinase [Streptomyces violaceusniger Tu 4113]
MISEFRSRFRSRFRFRHLWLGLVGVSLVVLVVLEGLNAPYPPMAAATMVSGVLCLAAFAVPERLFVRYAIGAAAVSCVLTLVEAQLPQRPENTPGMVELGVLLLLITRAVRRCRPLRAAGPVAGSALAAVVLPLRIAVWDGDLLNLIAVMAVCTVPFMVMVGLCLRLYDTLRERDREAVRQGQRLEHARELHDFVAHHVTAIVAQTKAARFTAAAGHTQSTEDLDRMLAQIERAGSQALGSMRAMVSSLRDHTTASATTRPTGDPAGLPGLRGLRDLTEEFSEVGPPAELTLAPQLADRPLPPGILTTVHRVVQESLTNVRKHATGVGRVEVRIGVRPGATERLEVSVVDDGEGGASPAAERSVEGSGYGLVGLAERVEKVDGRITAGPRDGGGWHVVAVLPLNKADKADKAYKANTVDSTDAATLGKAAPNVTSPG